MGRKSFSEAVSPYDSLPPRDVLFIGKTVSKMNTAVRFFREYGASVDCSFNFKTAARNLLNTRYCVVVIDACMDEIECGVNLLAFMREYAAILDRQPLVLLYDKSMESAYAFSFDVTCIPDDLPLFDVRLLEKPVSLGRLWDAIDGCLKKASSPDGGSILFGKTVLDTKEKLLICGERFISLCDADIQILLLFARRTGHFFTLDDLTSSLRVFSNYDPYEDAENRLGYLKRDFQLIGSDHILQRKARYGYRLIAKADAEKPEYAVTDTFERSDNRENTYFDFSDSMFSQ